MTSTPRSGSIIDDGFSYRLDRAGDKFINVFIDMIHKLQANTYEKKHFPGETSTGTETQKDKRILRVHDFLLMASDTVMQLAGIVFVSLIYSSLINTV